jgi:hypothetical protein
MAVSSPGNVIARNRAVLRLGVSAHETDQSYRQADQVDHGKFCQPARQLEQHPHQCIFDYLSLSKMAMAQAQLSRVP